MNLPPLYSECYHLTVTLLKKTASMPKHYRPTLGRRLEDTTLDLLLELKRTLLSKDKHNLPRVLAKIDDLKLLSQLTYDLRCMSPAEYGELTDTLVRLGKMTGGLSRYERAKQHTEVAL